MASRSRSAAAWLIVLGTSVISASLHQMSSLTFVSQATRRSVPLAAPRQSDEGLYRAGQPSIPEVAENYVLSGVDELDGDPRKPRAPLQPFLLWARDVGIFKNEAEVATQETRSKVEHAFDKLAMATRQLYIHQYQMEWKKYRQQMSMYRSSGQGANWNRLLDTFNKLKRFQAVAEADAHKKPAKHGRPSSKVPTTQSGLDATSTQTQAARRQAKAQIEKRGARSLMAKTRSQEAALRQQKEAEAQARTRGELDGRFKY
eukprot:TRINITY_DN93294_c0_g1_i1.p1 TRINITY_DN93294_c0_g1~~TRINITY_DN93294_c0_g1_i1.p1  ORF type:complete len:259 (+),score=52.79 TRINITY_DN93294_c0_g1_i1:111-887(+)